MLLLRFRNAKHLTLPEDLWWEKYISLKMSDKPFRAHFSVSFPFKCPSSATSSSSSSTITFPSIAVKSLHPLNDVGGEMAVASLVSMRMATMTPKYIKHYLPINSFECHNQRRVRLWRRQHKPTESMPIVVPTMGNRSIYIQMTFSAAWGNRQCHSTIKITANNNKNGICRQW